ncbi:MAG TPA: UpxY family transcription antiterminator [Candidatus Acidoferrum sp.]|nr:UpxY family transcription antiterminator [Candidatus Acidoferrum sp.]
MLNILRTESNAAPLSGAGIPDGEEVQAFGQLRWYAAYTRANHEKRVADQLLERGVENFLPQYESVRKWKDRRVLLQLPLFPGYVFVHLALQNRLDVLQVPGVARLVGYAGRPVAVPEDEFARIREFLKKGLHAEPHPHLTIGRRVRVRSGPLEGAEGIVIRRKNGNRLVISLELIQRAMAVDLNAADLEALS